MVRDALMTTMELIIIALEFLPKETDIKLQQSVFEYL